MIYEIMNCEDFRENNTSFIVGLELADEFVTDVYNSDEEFFYKYTEEEIEDILNENEFFVCSRNTYGDGDVEYFIEPLLHDEGTQYYLESDYVFIEDNLVDVIDIDKILADDIFILEIEEDEELDDYECDYCQGYDDGYNQAILEVCELLNNKLKIE